MWRSVWIDLVAVADLLVLTWWLTHEAAPTPGASKEEVPTRDGGRLRFAGTMPRATPLPTRVSPRFVAAGLGMGPRCASDRCGARKMTSLLDSM